MGTLRAIATMVVDFTQLPAETASVLIVANAVEDLPIIHTSFKINALTSGNLDNSFVCTEPLASYVMAEKGELRAYILAKYASHGLACATTRLTRTPFW